MGAAVSLSVAVHSSSGLRKYFASTLTAMFLSYLPQNQAIWDIYYTNSTSLRHVRWGTASRRHSFWFLIKFVSLWMQDYKYLYAAAVNIRDTLVNTRTHTLHTHIHTETYSFPLSQLRKKTQIVNAKLPVEGTVDGAAVSASVAVNSSSELRKYFASTLTAMFLSYLPQNQAIWDIYYTNSTSLRRVRWDTASRSEACLA